MTDYIHLESIQDHDDWEKYSNSDCDNDTNYNDNIQHNQSLSTVTKVTNIKTYKKVSLDEIARIVILVFRNQQVDKYRPTLGKGRQPDYQRCYVMSCFSKLLGKPTEQILKYGIEMYSSPQCNIQTLFTTQPTKSKQKSKEYRDELEYLENTKRQLHREIKESHLQIPEKIEQLKTITNEWEEKRKLFGILCTSRQEINTEIPHIIKMLKLALDLFSVSSEWAANNDVCGKAKIQTAIELYDIIEKTTNPTEFFRKKEEKRLANEESDKFFHKQKEEQCKKYKINSRNKHIEIQISKLNKREQELLQITKQIILEKKPLFDVYRKYKEMAEYELSNNYTDYPVKHEQEQVLKSNTISEDDMNAALVLKKTGKFIPAHLKQALAKVLEKQNNQKVDIIPINIEPLTIKLNGAWKNPISNEVHKRPVPSPPKKESIEKETYYQCFEENSESDRSTQYDRNECIDYTEYDPYRSRCYQSDDDYFGIY